MYDISMTNTTCRDFKNSHMAENIMLAGEIENINIVKTKQGKAKGAEMAFVTIGDSTGLLDSVVLFPDQYKSYKNALFVGNVIILKGNRSKSRDGFVVEKVYLPKT